MAVQSGSVLPSHRAVVEDVDRVCALALLVLPEDIALDGAPLHLLWGVDTRYY